jgi:hypothetical protein
VNVFFEAGFYSELVTERGRLGRDADAQAVLARYRRLSSD